MPNCEDTGANRIKQNLAVHRWAMNLCWAPLKGWRLVSEWTPKGRRPLYLTDLFWRWLDDSLTSYWHDSLRSVRLLDTLTCHQNISKQFKKNKIHWSWIRDMSNNLISYCHMAMHRVPEWWAWALNSVSVTRGRRTTEPSIGPSVTTLGWHAEMQFLTYTSDPLKTKQKHERHIKVLHLDKRIAEKGAPRASVGLEARSVLRQKLKPSASSLLTRSQCTIDPHISPHCHFHLSISYATICRNTWFGFWETSIGSLGAFTSNGKRSICWFHPCLFETILSKNGKHYCKLQKCMNKRPFHTG